MPTDLSAYRWHHRLLVLFAPSAGDLRLVRQEAAFRRESAGMRDRDLLRIVVLPPSTDPKGLDARALRRRYRVAPGAFAALLVGKDGTVAYRTRGLVTPRLLFARIDAMPMRRQEIRDKRQGKG